MVQKWGLKAQFVTVFLVLITLPTVLFGMLIYYNTTAAFKQQAIEDTEDRIEKNEETLTSTIRSVENMTAYMIYDKNFRRVFKVRTEDTANWSYRQSEEAIKGYFTFQLTSQPFINSISLKGEAGNELAFGHPVFGDESWIEQKAREKKGGIHWSGAYEMDSGWGGKKQVMTLTRVINDINDITDPIGEVKIRLDQPALYETMEAKTTKAEGTYFVISKEGKVVLHANDKLLGKTYPEKRITDLVVNSGREVIRYETNNKDYLVVKKPIQGTDWFSVAIVNEETVIENLYNVRQLFVGMIVSLLLLGLLALAGFYIFNIRRILELARQTEQLRSGDFSAHVNVTSNDEIGLLGARFNHMVETIQQYINREYKLKIKQKESELKLLQSQIDPHFLYNTLDMIRWTARLEQAMETGQLIERLSKIFRISLSSGRTWINIEEEILFLQNYLELQKSRLGDRLTYSIFYDEEIKGAYIMKQLIQPIVENCIVHGFRDLPYKGLITIRIYRNEHELWIDVIDNGHGFTGDKQFETTNGYALKNIQERLRMAFGDHFGIQTIPVSTGAFIRINMGLLFEKDVFHQTND